MMVAVAAPMLMGFLDQSGDFQQRILAQHNLEREDVGVPDMRWNASLAVSAQQWADHLARTGRFEHAPENRREPQGENLWAGTRGYYSPEAMVNAWVREKRYFKPGSFPNNSITGRVEDVGHFTQVAWRDSREVGCAVARSDREDILVCRYTQAGNYVGEQPF
ncbi:MAG: CAP family protein [Caulobacteraceae bacterium]